MPIDEKAFKKLKWMFAYLEEYDRLLGKPTKRVPICVTIPLKLKRKLEKRGGNISRFVEKVLSEGIKT